MLVKSKNQNCLSNTSSQHLLFQRVSSMVTLLWHHIFWCLLPATHREIRDGIEVRAQHFSVLEKLISKGVKPVQRDEQVSGCHPFLEKKKKRKWYGKKKRYTGLAKRKRKKNQCKRTIVGKSAGCCHSWWHKKADKKVGKRKKRHWASVERDKRVRYIKQQMLTAKKREEVGKKIWSRKLQCNSRGRADMMGR